MCEADAKAAGDRAAENEKTPVNDHIQARLYLRKLRIRQPELSPIRRRFRSVAVITSRRSRQHSGPNLAYTIYCIYSRAGDESDVQGSVLMDQSISPLFRSPMIDCREGC